MLRPLSDLRTRAGLAALTAGTVAIGLLSGCGSAAAPVPPAQPAPPAATAPRTPAVLAAAPAPRGLPVIDYWTAPRGFPADPAAATPEVPAEGLHPTRSVAVYDAPGGRPRARLEPEISGMELVLPITARRAGWAAVLLPTANRRIGWLPPRGWTTRPLRDHLVLRLSTHELTWHRDGRPRETWKAATGTKQTPTPLGRSFVLGRTPTSGPAFAGVDALALSSVPEDRNRLPKGLREAHTGIHGWTDPEAFGRSTSNGCIRLPAAAQQTLLDNVGHGTVVTVVA